MMLLNLLTGDSINRKIPILHILIIGIMDRRCMKQNSTI